MQGLYKLNIFTSDHLKMECPHQVKCCHYCPCHYLDCKRCTQGFLVFHYNLDKESAKKYWICPKCAAPVPYKLEDINDFRIIKKK